MAMPRDNSSPGGERMPQHASTANDGLREAADRTGHSSSPMLPRVVPVPISPGPLDSAPRGREIDPRADDAAQQLA
jgi:hypothetical protein